MFDVSFRRSSMFDGSFRQSIRDRLLPHPTRDSFYPGEDKTPVRCCSYRLYIIYIQSLFLSRNYVDQILWNPFYRI